MIGRQWRQKFKSWTNQILCPFAPPIKTLLGDLPCLSNFRSAWLHPVKNVISTVLVLLTILGTIKYCQPLSCTSFLFQINVFWSWRPYFFRRKQFFSCVFIWNIQFIFCSSCDKSDKNPFSVEGGKKKEFASYTENTHKEGILGLKITQHRPLIANYVRISFKNECDAFLETICCVKKNVRKYYENINHSVQEK